jgi:hypothetical protein
MARLIRSTATVTKKTRTSAINDDAVTLAKMAAGTDGNIISYDASGDPVAIATGTDGQVLTSTGAGSPPAFEAVSTGIADPGSSTDNQLVRWNGASGDAVQDSGIVVSDDGHMTNATLPAFHAYMGPTCAQIGHNAKMDFDTVLFNTGSHFSTTTQTFTAPITGVYQFHLGVPCNTISESGTYFAFLFSVTGHATGEWSMIQNEHDAQEYWSYHRSQIFHMDINDTCLTQCRGNSTPPISAYRTGSTGAQFSGCLIG